jgi:tRNA pseudouridine13 synthase
MDPQRTASPLEEELGLRFYSTVGTGTGGRLRSRPEDFIVEEITREGLVANEALAWLSRGEGRYSLAVLTKTSRDTIPTSRQVGEALGASVSFAGIKDRRATTSQLISIDRPLEQGELELGIPRVAVRVVGTSKWPLEPGELRGNRFTITVRGLEKGLPEGFKIDWLPSYFGHQRFGTTRPNTHRIGRLLVKKDFGGAVRELVAEPYPNEPHATAEARVDLKASWDIRRALKDFPRSLTYERMVLRRLMEAPGDPLSALKALPWSMIRLYINAYQSYLFNLALSRRWEQCGLQSLENGDFASPLDSWGSPARPIKTSPYNASTLRKMVSSKKGILMVRVVGARTKMEGKDKEVYSEILETEGITLQHFENIAGSPFFGTLRFSMFRAIDFSLSGASTDELSPGMQRQTLVTSLPKGCYATVLLRETMRPVDPFAAGF